MAAAEMKTSTTAKLLARKASERYGEVQAFIHLLNDRVPRKLWLPMPAPVQAYELMFMRHPLAKRESILAIFRDGDLNNYIKLHAGAIPSVKQNSNPYALVNGTPLFDGVCSAGPCFQRLEKDGITATWQGPQKTNSCRQPHLYAVVDMGGILMIQCLDTGFIPAEIVLTRVGALTKNGKKKDPRDIFTIQEQISLLTTMCKTCNFIKQGVNGFEFDYGRLVYPDMSSVVNKAGISKAASAEAKEQCKDVSHGLNCFGRMWVHPMLMDMLFRWSNCTYETGSVIAQALMVGENITAQEAMKRALDHSSPMEMVNIETALYVGAYPELPGQCKVGLSRLSCDELRGEYKRGVPGLDIRLFRRIPKGEVVEAEIKRDYKQYRIPNTSPDTPVEKQSYSEVYKQPPEEMIRIVKLYDPEWKACVAAGTTDTYTCIESGRYNLNRAESVMGKPRPSVMTAKTTKTKTKTKEVDGVSHTTTTTTTSTTEITSPEDRVLVVISGDNPVIAAAQESIAFKGTQEPAK